VNFGGDGDACFSEVPSLAQMKVGNNEALLLFPKDGFIDGQYQSLFK
jgi:hypothetical protein